MIDFKQWLQSTPEYKTLVFQHGERLFIRRDGEYDILTVRLAYRAWCQSDMKGLNYDSYTPMRFKLNE